jgi:hypothetical protein
MEPDRSKVAPFRLTIPTVAFAVENKCTPTFRQAEPDPLCEPYGDGPRACVITASLRRLS